MVRTLPSQQEGHGLDSLMGELLSVEFAFSFVWVVICASVLTLR